MRLRSFTKACGERELKVAELAQSLGSTYQSTSQLEGDGDSLCTLNSHVTMRKHSNL